MKSFKLGPLEWSLKLLCNDGVRRTMMERPAEASQSPAARGVPGEGEGEG